MISNGKCTICCYTEAYTTRSCGIKVKILVWQCYLEHVLFKDSTFAALPPLLWAIWTLLVLGALIPRWTGMSAWVSSIHGVRPQGDGHTADGSQHGAKVTSSSLHPMEPSSYFTATGLCECVCVCVWACVCVCVCGGHVLAGSHLSTMRTGKRGTSNYVGRHSRWYLIYLWNHIGNALHITIKCESEGFLKLLLLLSLWALIFTSI